MQDEQEIAEQLVEMIVSGVIKKINCRIKRNSEKCQLFKLCYSIQIFKLFEKNI